MKAIFAMMMGLTVISLAGCAGGSDSSQAEVNGKPAGEYFAQFLSDDPQTLCQAGADEITVKSVTTSFRGSLVTLYLFKSGAARLVIEGNGASVWKTKWQVHGTDLIVGDDFVLSGLTYNERETLSMQTRPQALDVPYVLKSQRYLIFEKSKDYWHCTQLPQ